MRYPPCSASRPPAEPPGPTRQARSRVRRAQDGAGGLGRLRAPARQGDASGERPRARGRRFPRLHPKPVWRGPAESGAGSVLSIALAPKSVALAGRLAAALVERGQRGQRPRLQRLALVPHIVGRSLPGPCHFPARIQSFQSFAAPFAGVSQWPVRTLISADPSRLRSFNLAKTSTTSAPSRVLHANRTRIA